MVVDNLVYVMADSSFFDVEIYDINIGETVFTGTADNIPEEYLPLEICSIDSPMNSKLCININTEELEEED